MADFSDVLFVSDFDHTMTGTDGTIPLANRRAIAAGRLRDGLHRAVPAAVSVDAAAAAGQCAGHFVQRRPLL